MSRYLYAAAVTVGITLSACDTTEYLIADPEPSIADAGQLTTPHAYSDLLDLVPLLDPNGIAKTRYENGQHSKAWNDLEKGEQIDLAFQAFYDRNHYTGDVKLRRNRIQERLLAVSNRRCNLFKSILYQLRAKTNFGLGALTTISGVAGALVTGVDGSRVLSGISGIFSGLRGEFNQEMFQNLATQVIIQGVDTRRRETYDQIVKKGQTKTIEHYTAEAAVKDAIFYHGQCSVIVGFEMAGDAIKTVDDPGIEDANRTLAKLAVTRKLLDVGNITPKQAADLLGETNARLPIAGTSLGQAEDEVSPIQAIEGAGDAIRRRHESFEGYVNSLEVSPPSGERDEDMVLKLETQQRQPILAELQKATGLARLALGKCVEEALKASQDVVVANQNVDAQTTESARLVARNVRDRTLLAALAVSTKINLVPTLYGLIIDAAAKAIKGGATKLNEGEALPDNAVTDATTALKNASTISAC